MQMMEDALPTVNPDVYIKKSDNLPALGLRKTFTFHWKPEPGGTDGASQLCVASAPILTPEEHEHTSFASSPLDLIVDLTSDMQAAFAQVAKQYQVQVSFGSMPYSSSKSPLGWGCMPPHAQNMTVQMS